MVQIDISFVPGVGTQVSPDPSSAHTDDSVNWIFHSFDPNVKSVQIEFQSASDSYFFAHKTGGAKVKSVSTDLVSNSATIWGRAPVAQGNGTQKKVKYTINAYDQNGQSMNQYYLDPDVVTEQP